MDDLLRYRQPFFPFQKGKNFGDVYIEALPIVYISFRKMEVDYNIKKRICDV